MQHTTCVAQPHYALAVQNVRVDAGNLRCRIGTQSKQASARLVGQLECTQIEIIAGSREQRLCMLE